MTALEVERGPQAPDSATAPLAPDSGSGTAYREVRYEYSRNLVPLLTHLGASLLVSTYQAGKLVVVGVHRDTLALSLHNFEQAMGLAVGPGRIAVGTRSPDLVLAQRPGHRPPAGPERPARWLLPGALGARHRRDPWP